RSNSSSIRLAVESGIGRGRRKTSVIGYSEIVSSRCAREIFDFRISIGQVLESPAERPIHLTRGPSLSFPKVTRGAQSLLRLRAIAHEAPFCPWPVRLICFCFRASRAGSGFGD